MSIKTIFTALLLLISILSSSLFFTSCDIIPFPDNEKDGENLITSGNVDLQFSRTVGLELDTFEDASGVKSFDVNCWEPGYTVGYHYKAENVGETSLEYDFLMFADGKVSALANVIDVYYATPAKNLASNADLASFEYAGTLSKLLSGTGIITSGVLNSGEEVTLTIILHMQESAGNEYCGILLDADISVRLFANEKAN